jgi:hypothetical protein
LREAHQQFVENFRVLAQNLEDQVREIRKNFDERIQQEIVKVTSDDIAEALTKRVPTVRIQPVARMSTWLFAKRRRLRFKQASFF